MIASNDPAWDDQDSSWWAKINRARAHLESARHLAGQFRASHPYALVLEPTAKPGRVAYRLRVARPAPVAVGVFELLEHFYEHTVPDWSSSRDLGDHVGPDQP